MKHHQCKNATFDTTKLAPTIHLGHSFHWRSEITEKEMADVCNWVSGLEDCELLLLGRLLDDVEDAARYDASGAED